MPDINTAQQSNNANEEFEYIELEEGQELPDGYEYEYVEVPADEISEMDVVNRPHAFDADDEGDVASPSVIDASLQSSQDDEVRKEAPFPSFLQADYENSSDLQNAELGDVLSSAPAPQATVDVNDIQVSIADSETIQTSHASSDETWQNQVGTVAPTDFAQKENVNFLNKPQPIENWQEDSRATYDLESVRADESDVQFQQNNISSIHVDDYIEPEAHFKASEIAVTEIPHEHPTIETQFDVTDVAHSEKTEEDVSLDISNVENDVSIDDLLQENETEFVDVDHLVEMNTDPVEEVVATVESVPAPVEEVSAPIENLSTQVEKVVAPVEDVAVPLEKVAASIEVEKTAFPTQNSTQVPSEDIEHFIGSSFKNAPDENVSLNAHTETVNVWEDVAPDVSHHIVSADENANDFVMSNTSNYQTELPVKDDEQKIDNDYNAENFASYQENVVLTSANQAEQLNPHLLDFDVFDFGVNDAPAAESHAHIVSKQQGIASFKASEDVFDILLTDVDFAQNELSAWNLVLYQKSLIPLEKPVSELVRPQNVSINRYVSVVQGGNSKVNLFNEDDLKIINASHACVGVQGRFLCGDFDTNSGVIIDDFITLPLSDFAGKKIAFNMPASGILAGPDGYLLFFFGVKNLWVPSSDVAVVDAQKLQYKISKWYSGTAHDKYFEFSAQSENGEFIGNEEMNAIHVNVNNSSYGWNVAFDNGLSMNLRDLREYQTRFGKIPSPNGIISYGQKTLKFQNVERIVVYEAAQYFFYN